ncbi:Hypothetical predicted protein [Olea europaea subsp. europaea]|uniref:Uncharacterized protein n=1 Tax=Olea europaea subsp. europaea TaxID=158383 RepID=A0A8S0Q313_OLEEU|nr:Hypothetical predicted protein [Olea europaea subsp. europaea]
MRGNEEVKHERNEEYEDLLRVFDNLARITEKRDVIITLHVTFCKAKGIVESDGKGRDRRERVMSICSCLGYIQWCAPSSGPDANDEERGGFPLAYDFRGNEEQLVFLLHYRFGG